MTSSSSGEVSQLLQAWNDGDETALEKLMPVVYKELHRMARFYMDQDPNLKSLHGDPRFDTLVVYAKQRTAATKTSE